MDEKMQAHGHYRVRAPPMEKPLRWRTEIKYGRTKSADGVYQGYPKIFRALHKRGEIWDILSEHKTKKAAQDQCEYHAEHGKLKPRNTKVEKANRILKKKQQIKRQAKRKAKEE